MSMNETGSGSTDAFAVRPRIPADIAASAPIKVGDASIRRLEEARYKFPMSMFGLSGAALDAQRSWLAPRFMDADGNWDMVVQCWIAIVDGTVVVVDPCVGNGRSFPDLPMFDRLETPFIERFAASGVRPEDVNVVFCTHLHSDHCGWNTQLRNGRYVPTFPNARYVMVKRELDRWDSRRAAYDTSEIHNKLNAGVFENSVLPVLEAGLADVVPDTHRISPALQVEPAYGHTVGHSSLHLRSGGGEAYFTGDVFHHPIELVHPEIDAHTCEHYPTTVETRRRLLEKLIASGALLIPGHFAAPYVGYVRRTAGVVTFEPFAG